MNLVRYQGGGWTVHDLGDKLHIVYDTTAPRYSDRVELLLAKNAPPSLPLPTPSPAPDDSTAA